MAYLMVGESVVKYGLQGAGGTEPYGIFGRMFEVILL